MVPLSERLDCTVSQLIGDLTSISGYGALDLNSTQFYDVLMFVNADLLLLPIQDGSSSDYKERVQQLLVNVSAVYAEVKIPVRLFA